MSTVGLDPDDCQRCGDQPRPWECLSDGLCPGCWRQEHRGDLRADGGQPHLATRAHAHGGLLGLRFGYWMQFWAGVYALTSVYPNPGLSALVVAVLVVLVVLIYDARPPGWGGGS